MASYAKSGSQKVLKTCSFLSISGQKCANPLISYYFLFIFTLIFRSKTPKSYKITVITTAKSSKLRKSGQKCVPGSISGLFYSAFGCFSLYFRSFLLTAAMCFGPVPHLSSSARPSEIPFAVGWPSQF
jgi:hypothetical protein